MIRMIKRTIKGCGYVPGYGTHPGTPIIWYLTFLGFSINLVNGTLMMAIVSASLMLIIFGIPYLWSAHERAVDGEKDFIRGLTKEYK